MLYLCIVNDSEGHEKHKSKTKPGLQPHKNKEHDTKRNFFNKSGTYY